MSYSQHHQHNIQVVSVGGWGQNPRYGAPLMNLIRPRLQRFWNILHKMYWPLMNLISNWLFHTAIVTAYFSNVVNECNPLHINVLTTIFVTVSTYHNCITLMYSLSIPQSSIYTSINPQYLSLRQLGSCLSSSSVPRSSRSASKPTLIWGFQSSTTSQLG